MSDEEREILLLAQIQPLTIEELRFLILRALTRVSSNSSLEFIFQVVAQVRVVMTVGQSVQVDQRLPLRNFKKIQPYFTYFYLNT